MSTKEELQARFHALTAESNAIRARSMPLRERRDKIVRAAREKEEALNDEIREAEAGLFEIDQERAVIVRALKGETGKAPQ